MNHLIREHAQYVLDVLSNLDNLNNPIYNDSVRAVMLYDYIDVVKDNGNYFFTLNKKGKRIVRYLTRKLSI